MLTDSTKTIIRCSRCGVEKATKRTRKGGDRLPTTWKRDVDGEAWCRKCWDAAYRLAVCIVPVAEAVGDSKDDLWAAMRTLWGASTHAANLATQVLQKADVVRSPSMEKLPPMPAVYLYGETKGLTGVDPSSMPGLLRSVEAKYRAKRYDVVWRGDTRPTRHLYPQPYPLIPEHWRVEIDPVGGQAVMHCRFGGRWWALRLRGGHEFYRQREQLLVLASLPPAMRVEAALYRNKGGTRIMAKLIGWFQREPQRAIRTGGEMQVATGGGRFLCAVVRGRDPWILNEDRMRDKIQRHAWLNQRSADDTKFEKRWPKAVREKLLADNRARCQRQNDRLKTFCDQRAALLANFANRCNVASVRYDDADKSYFESFPWFQFREQLKRKLEQFGIDFVCERSAGGETPGTARGTPTGDD